MTKLLLCFKNDGIKVLTKKRNKKKYMCSKRQD